MREIVLRTEDAPDWVTFDALMRQAFTEPTRVLLADGVFRTGGLPEWNRNRPARGFVMNGSIESAGAAKSTIELDPAAFDDDDVTSVPQRLITGCGVFDNPSIREKPTDAEAVWRALPRGQYVKNVRLVCNHSKLVERFKARGQSLRSPAILLQGHNAAIEGCEVVDSGAWRTDPAVGAENFPFAIMGATGAPDRDAIATLDPETHVFSDVGPPSHITGSTFTGYVPGASNDQVTVRMITGSFGEANGSGRGGWVFTWQADAYQEDNHTEAKGKNLVQCHTIYLAKKGTIRKNTSEGADIGYYGDFLQTKGIVIEENSFGTDAAPCRHGVALYLSPTPSGGLAEKFSHENYEIGLNKIVSRDQQVSINTLSEMMPTSATRYIKGIRVHSLLSLENLGGEVTRFGEDRSKRKGCNPFGR